MRTSSRRRARSSRSTCVEQIGRSNAPRQLGARQIAEAQQQIVDAVRGARAVVFREALQLLFHLGDRIGIEQFAQIGIAQQLAQLILVDGQRLRAALGQRRIAVVDVVGHVAEQQRRRERRRLARVHHVHAQLALLDGAQRLEQRRHVEDIAQALAIGLQQQRKRGIARSDAQQVVRALALLPQRERGIGAAARQQQRARGGLAKLAANSAVEPSCRSTSSMASAGLDQDPVRIGRRIRLRKAQHKSVVAPHRLDFAGRPRRECAPLTAIAHGVWMRLPNGVSTQTRQSPSSSRHALDHDGAIVRHRAGRRSWSARNRSRFSAAPGSRSCSRDQPGQRRGLGMSRSSRTSAPMRRPNSSGRPRPSPCQNGILPGSPGAGVPARGRA